MRKVLKTGSWCVNGFIMSIYQWRASTPLEDYHVNKIRMWIQVLGLSIEKQESRVSLTKICRGFSDYFEVDTIGGFNIHGMFKRILVSFHLKSLLPKKILIDLGEREVLVKFKYKRISFFFFALIVDSLAMVISIVRITLIIL